MTAALLLRNATVVAAVAAVLNVTVQGLVEAPDSDAGVQITELSDRGPAGVNVRLKVFDTPLRDAVTVTVALTAPLLTAENEAVAEPAATLTDCGTVTAALLLLNATVVAAVAAVLNVTVQALVEAPDSDAGVQITELSVGVAVVTVMVPPVAEIDPALPAAVAPCTLPKVMAAVWEAVALSTATTPLPMGLALGPDARQVYDPLFEVHDSDLPAAVSAAPAVAETPLSADGEY